MATRALLETALCYQSGGPERRGRGRGDRGAVRGGEELRRQVEGSLGKASELESRVPEELRPFMYGQRVVLLDEKVEAAKGASLDLRKAGCPRAALGLALRFEEHPGAGCASVGGAEGALGHAGVAGSVRRVDSPPDGRLEGVGETIGRDEPHLEGVAGG